MLKAAVLGASGFVGGELLRLLGNHPNVDVVFASSESQAGKEVRMLCPNLRRNKRISSLKFQSLKSLPKVDIVFSCLPNGNLPQILSYVEEKTNQIINLAGDYRLKSRTQNERHYPQSLAHDWPTESIYFVPEFSNSPPTEKLVNLPGCMASTVLYATYPLVKHQLIEGILIADVKTASSGAGKKTKETPAERSNNFRSYKLHGHRHQPEVEETLTRVTGEKRTLTFAVHSLDLPRGIFATIYSRLKAGYTSLDVKRAFARTYAKHPFIHYFTANRGAYSFPTIKSVVGSNMVELGTSVQSQECIAVATLDNLLKGAAGQAIQAFNLIHQFPEGTSLPTEGVWP